jgi:hypothetical protein
MTIKIIIRYFVAAALVGALLYFGIKMGQPGGLRVETSGL